MGISEFQLEAKAVLEGAKHLLSGCRILCADELDVVANIEEALARLGEIVVLISQPEIDRDGCNPGFIPCRTTLRVQCIELPALRHTRKSPGDGAPPTAFAAACRVAAILDGAKYNFVSIRQYADAATGTLTATVTFNSYLQL